MMYNENVQRKISENYPLFISFSLLKLDQNIWIIDEIKNLKLKTLLFKLDEGKEKIIVKTNNQPFVNIIVWYLLNRSPQDRDLDISFDLYCKRARRRTDLYNPLSPLGWAPEHPEAQISISIIFSTKCTLYSSTVYQ